MQYPSLSCISTQAYLVLLVKKSLLPASSSKEILVWRYLKTIIVSFCFAEYLEKFIIGKKEEAREKQAFLNTTLNF